MVIVIVFTIVNLGETVSRDISFCSWVYRIVLIAWLLQTGSTRGSDTKATEIFHRNCSMTNIHFPRIRMCMHAYPVSPAPVGF